ncbi:GlxA family transcriptional regulator [Variovorax sp. WS11]|uniref:GlxA family transcriptional regulator n=1 Tax=Variovorax sp. WS11 TaxID=1105204 RepID=UPI0015E78DAD|nr:helix-turn-helix domain-containing protein [Variovorax sp. WS11]
MQRVLFLLLPGFAIVDVAGAVAVFDMANDVLSHLGKPPPYRLRLLAATEKPVLGSSGIPLGTHAVPMRVQGAIAKLIIAGDSRASIQEFDAAERRILPCWLQRHARQVELGATIGRAARALAQAPCATPMDSHRARTSPVAQARWIEVSLTRGAHLAMDLVAQDHGSVIASVIASRLGAPFRDAYRNGASQAPLVTYSPADPRIDELHRWIARNLRQSFSVASLAEHLAMSERTFTRFYRRATGSTPAAGVERIRLDAARRHLESSLCSIKAISLQCGFASSEVMRRAFIRNLRVSPKQYRQLLASSSSRP